ncbi:MAG TPA: hypothetical protein VFZ53_29980, partial [Polyangiaceae bacterium]
MTSRVGIAVWALSFTGVAAAQAPGPQAPGPATPPVSPPSDAPPGSFVVPGQGGSIVITPGSTTTTLG